jgi:orotate phosphoribosyltransferase
MNLDIKNIYQENNAFLKGHFLLSSGKHSEYYLQSARVLENPKIAQQLASSLSEKIKESNIQINTICSPALGGLIAGYALACALGVRFIFTERVDGIMSLRRGFEVSNKDNILICEDIITTGGSAMESANVVEKLGANIVGFGALANRGFCKRVDGINTSSSTCKLPKDLPFFALDDFSFDIYDKNECPLCKNGSTPYKPGSRTK